MQIADDAAERRRPEPLGSSSMLPMIPETVFSETPGPDSGDRPDPLVANGIDEPGLGWVSQDRSQPHVARRDLVGHSDGAFVAMQVGMQRRTW